MVFPCPPWRTLGARGDLLRCHPDAGSRADESLPAGAGPNDVATRLDAASGRPWATGHDVTAAAGTAGGRFPEPLARGRQVREAHIFGRTACISQTPVGPALTCAYSAACVRALRDRCRAQCVAARLPPLVVLRRRREPAA